MKIRTSTLWMSGLALAIFSNIAAAHPGHASDTGFGAGVLHPISGIDHILAMVAVGLWASQIGGRAIWALPATFVSLMVGGGLLQHFGLHLPLIEQCIMASVLVLGLMIAMAAKLPVPGMMTIVGLFAIFHGYAHVAEATAGQSPTAYVAGFVLATAILHAAGIGLGLTMKHVLPNRVTRAAGAAIACCGVLLFLNVL